MSTLANRPEEAMGHAACAWCHQSRSTSPSDDFCSESCQQNWHAAHEADLSITRDRRPAA